MRSIRPRYQEHLSLRARFWQSVMSMQLYVWPLAQNTIYDLQQGTYLLRIFLSNHEGIHPWNRMPMDLHLCDRSVAQYIDMLRKLPEERRWSQRHSQVVYREYYSSCTRNIVLRQVDSWTNSCSFYLFQQQSHHMHQRYCRLEQRPPKAHRLTSSLAWFRRRWVRRYWVVKLDQRLGKTSGENSVSFGSSPWDRKWSDKQVHPSQRVYLLVPVRTEIVILYFESLVDCDLSSIFEDVGCNWDFFFPWFFRWHGIFRVSVLINAHQPQRRQCSLIDTRGQLQQDRDAYFFLPSATIHTTIFRHPSLPHFSEPWSEQKYSIFRKTPLIVVRNKSSPSLYKVITIKISVLLWESCWRKSNFSFLKSAGSQVAAVYRVCVNSFVVLSGNVSKKGAGTLQSQT